MALIQWDDSLKLGVVVVDRQHERLIDVINRLHEAMAKGRAADVISEIMDELIIYTGTHFSMVEKYFAELKYPDAEEYKREYDALIGKVIAFIDEFKRASANSRQALAKELLEFLQIWWRHHMMDTDSKFVALFREKGLT